MEWIAFGENGLHALIAKIKAFSVGDTAPENTNLLWIDTGAGVTKYYTGSAWVALPVAWG